MEKSMDNNALNSQKIKFDSSPAEQSNSNI